ncbi:CBS domain-containing protein [Mucilaginibacter sp. HMF7410]|uniref:CBS domain-containing protein n=2 Tax=Mucilaginibacter arboris TaxID=2682090 RepID=A0A7K1SXC6_9SPHI|nr:CBS domain-containing protein [Mucilaginibacter arboris]
MKKISLILEKKGRHVYSVTAATSVFDALQVMMEKNISALLVMEKEELLGIFTERDYARKLILQGKSSKETMIGEIMTADLLTLSPNHTIDYCMEMMTDKKIRHLPVLENKYVIGMISIGDVVKFVIEDQKQTIQQLETYIAS